VVFLIDFFVRLYQAPSKFRFLKWGWIDLLSSIPMVESLRWGRAVRIIRVVRLLRAFRSAKYLIDYLYQNRAQGTFGTVALISVVLMIFSAIAVIVTEQGLADANIQTAEDALWWTFVTMTTVGYGDYYPVTPEGRVVAAILMAAGVGLFGTFTGYVATLFIEADEAEAEGDMKALLAEVRALREEVTTLRAEVSTGKRGDCSNGN